MSEYFSSILGRRGGRTYTLTVGASPSFDHVEDFAVVVHYSDATTEKEIQVARIDTHHGYVHFDRLYRRDQPKDELDIGVWEATTLLEENWRTYAESFADLDRG